MTKPIFGLILGGILGVFDGLTAYFTPEVRNQLLGIVLGSTFKGLIAGLSIGYFSKKVDNLGLGIVFGLGVGLLLAFAVAAFPDANGKHYYFEIMLPGAMVGAIVGYATQKYRSRLSTA
jgi:prepilin signal peptidase PulO-like enzyme (type II secretory pathway)